MNPHVTTIATDSAPRAIGPYSQAVSAGNLVFVSGQLGLDPSSMQMVDGVAAQTRRALENLRAILVAAGCALTDVTACTVYLKNLNDFGSMNEVYSTFFADAPPSRVTVEVARLPKDGLVEISCIAARQG
jgi:2-iminobutanoate/2-iminopropanoate deaminase